MAFSIFQDDKYIKSWIVKVGYTKKELKENSDLKQLNKYLATHEAVLEAIRIWERECFLTSEDFIAYEMIFNNRHLIEIVGGILLVAAQRDIPVKEISPNTIKKRILGSGKSPKDYEEKKQLMVDCINKKFGLAIESHDQADSIAIAYTAYLLEKE